MIDSPRRSSILLRDIANLMRDVASKLVTQDIRGYRETPTSF
jgi:hypothetical protein